MRDYPQAAFAVALPPRAGLAAALELAAAERDAVVEAPLHDALALWPLPLMAASVRVAHGWVTLPGAAKLHAWLRHSGGGVVHVEIAGLPEEDGGDVEERLVHALALIRTLLPEAQPMSARLEAGGSMIVELLAGSPAAAWRVHLSLRARGRRLSARIDAGGELVEWSWEPDRELLSLGSTRSTKPRAVAAAPVRALAQLLPNAARGDGLVEAAAVSRLARHCLALLPAPLPLGSRALRQSASIAERRPSDLLARLGLIGTLPQADAVPPGSPAPQAPHEPMELWAFRAGIKPVAFLTVHPQDEAQTLAWFGNAHHERRQRRVQVATQDRWVDRRDLGEERVELYISRDAELARRAAYLQAEVDPSLALHELGELVGYPPCCVEAFAQQEDRANNSANRYHTWARTLTPDSSRQGPWPWQLNNLHTMIAPFYPCSYRCPDALAWVHKALAELGAVYPDYLASLRSALARPALYFDHEHQLVLDGACQGEELTYRAVAWSSPRLSPLAAAIASGSRLLFGDQTLVVERGGRVLWRWQRTDPALGFVAPFADGLADVAS